MTQKDLYGLRYFLAFALLLISFYVYAGLTGWKWLGATKTEKEKSTGTGTRYYGRPLYYHK